MDIDKIFGLFDNNLTGAPLGDLAETIDNVRDTPEFKVGMFTKIIMDHLNFNQKVIDFFTKTNNELDREDITKAGEFVIYNRSWYYIKDIDLKNKKHWYALEKMANPKTLRAIDLSIMFFEKREEYERCAHLMKISKSIYNFIK